jgi:hypothetical protein
MAEIDVFDASDLVKEENVVRVLDTLKNLANILYKNRNFEPQLRVETGAHVSFSDEQLELAMS